MTSSFSILISQISPSGSIIDDASFASKEKCELAAGVGLGGLLKEAGSPPPAVM